MKEKGRRGETGGGGSPRVQAHSTLDTVGMLCPAPIMKTAEKLGELQLGQVLEVISDDPGIEIDLPAWCRSTGHDFLGIERHGTTYHALVRKGRRTS